MSSFNRRLIFNTRERVLSTDQNDQQALIDSNLDNTAVAVAAQNTGVGYVAGATVASGVVDGLIVTANNPGVNLEVVVSPGLAYKLGTPPTSLDSSLRRIELTADYVLDLAALVQAQPRWVAIEIAPADVVELTAFRDIWQPATGTFVPANVEKIREPAPVITANAGTAGATPALPDGTAGTIPLAYVYLAGAATSVAVTDFVSCRPLYANLQDAQVRGGGINVGTTGGSTFSPAGQSGAWSSGASYSVTTSAISANPSGGYVWNVGESWAGLAGNNRAVYAYACAAPYPIGYDADVGRRTREFVNLTSVIPSCPVVTNPLVLLTTGAPAAGRFGGISLSSADPTWGSGGTISSSDCHYLGCVSYLESETGLVAQSATPATGEVRILEAMTGPIYQAVGTVAAGATTNFDFSPGDVDTLANTPPPGAGVAQPLGTLYHLVGILAGGASSASNIRLFDENSAANTIPVIQLPYSSNTGGTRALVWAYSTSTLRLTGEELDGVNPVDVAAFWCGYRDPTISRR